MERPLTMPLKDFLVKKLSLKLTIPESTINAVINYQNTEAFRLTSSKNTIELSGFGKFVFNQKKAQKQMIKYEQQIAAYEALLKEPDITPEKIRNTQMRINTTLKNIEHLTPKLTSNDKSDI